MYYGNVVGVLKEDNAGPAQAIPRGSAPESWCPATLPTPRNLDFDVRIRHETAAGQLLIDLETPRLSLVTVSLPDALSTWITLSFRHAFAAAEGLPSQLAGPRAPAGRRTAGTPCCRVARSSPPTLAAVPSIAICSFEVYAGPTHPRRGIFVVAKHRLDARVCRKLWMSMCSTGGAAHHSTTPSVRSTLK